MDPRQPQDGSEGELPWRRIGWIIFFCMIVLMIAVNAMFREVGYKTQIERARQASRLP